MHHYQNNGTNGLPKRTRAAVLTELNKPLELMDIDLPEQLSFGQVLVKIHYSGICGAQINEIEGAKGPDKFLPHLLGHEGSGTVLAIGPGVKTVKPDDRVVLHWRPGSGLQSETPKYRVGDTTVNAGWVTTFNDHAVVSENRLTTIPADFDLRIAPLFGCAVTTAMGVINNDAQVKIGQSVVIFGVGGVGLALAKSAEVVGAFPIVGVDIVDSKLTMAKSLGATHTCNSTNAESLKGRLLDIVGPNGFDVAIDTTGKPKIIELAYDVTSAAGKTILVGVPRKGDNVSLYTLPLHFEKVLTGSHGGSCQPDVDIPRYVRLVQNGRLDFSPLITAEYGLSEINQALAALKSGEAARILVRMN